MDKQHIVSQTLINSLQQSFTLEIKLVTDNRRTYGTRHYSFIEPHIQSISAGTGNLVPNGRSTL